MLHNLHNHKVFKNKQCLYALDREKKQYKDKECDDFLLFLTSVCLLILRKAFHIAKYILGIKIRK